MVNVNLLGFNKARLQVVVRESAKLQLEGECWFDVSNGLFFAPHSIKVTKSEVHGILSAAAEEDRNSTNTSSLKDGSLFVDGIDDLFVPLIFGHIIFLIEDAKCNIDDIWCLTVGPVSF